MSPNSLSKNTDSYNNAGVFLHAHVVKQFSDKAWSTDIEYPVTVAPFTTDPTRLDGKMRLPNSQFGVMSTRFVNSIQKSQNTLQTSERSVDVIAAKALTDKRDLKICVECKKLNPKYTEWCFFSHQKNIVNHAISKSIDSSIGFVTLFQVPNTEKYGNEIFVQLNREYNGFGLFSKNIVDYGIALTNEELWKKYYKTEQTVVDDACRQVIEGTYGLIIDELKHQVIRGDAAEYGITSIYLPMIVTNTNLKVCEYNKSDIDPASGKLTKEPTYKDVNSVLLEYNSPKNVQFPEPMFSPLDAETRKATSKWYVSIVTPKGLDDFLKQCEQITI